MNIREAIDVFLEPEPSELAPGGNREVLAISL